MVNIPTTLNNLKIKVGDLDVGKLKTVTIDLKKLSDVVDKKAVKNTKFNVLNTKVNNLEKKIHYAFTLIHINQCSNQSIYLSINKIWRNKLKMLIKNTWH